MASDEQRIDELRTDIARRWRCRLPPTARRRHSNMSRGDGGSSSASVSQARVARQGGGGVVVTSIITLPNAGRLAMMPHWPSRYHVAQPEPHYLRLEAT